MAARYTCRVSTVRGLLREVHMVSQVWPAGKADCLRRAREMIAARADIRDDKEKKRAIREGARTVEAAHALARLHRHRALRKAYPGEF